MIPLGTSAPNFSLPDTDGTIVSLDDFVGAPALLVMFLSNHCPYVKHVSSRLAGLTREYMAKGVAVVAINSNDIDAYPDDSPERMGDEKKRVGYPFRYLFDESQQVAMAYRAACTPDFFVFDHHHRLVYRGQMDDARPGNGKPVTGADLMQALDAVLTGEEVPADQRPSMGCNIKWKPGNEPG